MCYVNWLLFGKWGRSPSYEQNAPRRHALAHFQDVFHLHSWFGSVQQAKPLDSWPHLIFEWLHWCMEGHLLAMSLCRKINSWKMSFPECRFVDMWGWPLLLCVCTVVRGAWCVCVCVKCVPLRVTVPHSWSQCISPVQNYSFMEMFFLFFWDILYMLKLVKYLFP